jgi:hypothetical protein
VHSFNIQGQRQGGSPSPATDTSPEPEINLSTLSIVSGFDSAPSRSINFPHSRHIWDTSTLRISADSSPDPFASELDKVILEVISLFQCGAFEAVKLAEKTKEVTSIVERAGADFPQRFLDAQTPESLEYAREIFTNAICIYKNFKPTADSGSYDKQRFGENIREMLSDKDSIFYMLLGKETSDQIVKQFTPPPGHPLVVLLIVRPVRKIGYAVVDAKEMAQLVIGLPICAAMAPATLGFSFFAGFGIFANWWVNVEKNEQKREQTRKQDYGGSF